MNFAYYWYETAHAMATPARAFTEAAQVFLRNPALPFNETPAARQMRASFDVFERTTRRYAKPTFGLDRTVVDGEVVSVTEKNVWERPFGRLLHFDRGTWRGGGQQSNLLIVAPMSGHYATLLRGTVEAFLPSHEVYITDWTDARLVPLREGRFDLDDYIDYVIGMLEHLGPQTHVVAVCQPSVPVLAAIARMEAEGHEDAPLSMTLMGGPIDTRRSPTGVNQIAQERGIDWFRRNCIVSVPPSSPGFMRLVYPGFLQLSGFMAMNMDRHITAHRDYFDDLVKGDGDSADKHREFYDEYLAVMDLTAEFYLQTVDTVFVRHAMPKGEMMHRDKPVDLSAVRRTALMTVEGENDDISGVGQTQAAQDLCVNIPQDRRVHHLQERVGHYGVFNGSRFRAQIVPRMEEFMRAQEERARAERGIVTLRPRAEPRVGSPKEEQARVRAETADETDVERRARKSGAMPV